MILSLFRKDPARAAARALYETAVEQARSPVFYEDFEIPDTVEGRFEQVTLHVFLVLKRLQGEGPAASHLGQKLFDVMFQNMDDSLRELGVGDLSVGKKVRKLAEDFYGRAGAYGDALAPGADEKALCGALSRNIYCQAFAAQASRLAAYMRAADDALSAISLNRVLAGDVEFPDPAPAVGGETRL